MIGVDPEEGMLRVARQVSRDRVAEHPRDLSNHVEWRQGTASNLGLPDSCCDLVCAAQAFHWFPLPESLQEMARITRSGGVLALFWNNRVIDGEPIMEG